MGKQIEFNGKVYNEIDFCAGDRIEQAIEWLSLQRILSCGSFNGIMLFSDIDDIDSAYKKITGKTRAEFDSMLKSESEEYERKEQEHKQNIPSLSKEWINNGYEILEPEYHSYWKEIVPIRLGDLYRGMELKCCLDIVKCLNNDGTLEEAKSIIELQGHSGMSFGLVCSMVRRFCKRGSEFVSFVK